MPPKLTEEIVSAAIDGLEEKRRRLDEQIGELRTMLPGFRRNSGSTATSEVTPPKRKKFSAASRKKMAEAQKARWAKIKGETEPAQAAATPKASKRKRKMSAEGRQAIAEATRKRWEAYRAAIGQQEKAAKKATRKKGPVARKKTATKKTAAAPATEQAAG